METIGLIAAMPQECDALLQRVKQVEKSKLNSFRCYRFNLFGRNCLLVQSGMGSRRAMDATRALLNYISPQFLVSFGIAGAVQG